MRRAAPAVCLASSALALTLSAAALTGCSSASGSEGSPRLDVVHAYIPQPASPRVAAGYLTVRNDGGAADRLVRVTSDVTGDVTMHRTSGQSMREVNGFDVPADGRLTLDRAGSHLMLEGLREPLAVGEKVRLELRFAKSGTVEVEAPVRPLTYRPPSTEGDGDGPGGPDGGTGGADHGTAGHGTSHDGHEE
ncbi:hypothetical protein GCM10027168_05580 [Streptomyces capparidis]